MNKLFTQWIKSWITMKRLHCVFVVDGKEVYLYKDCYGAYYLANHFRWGFRVMVNPIK